MVPGRTVGRRTAWRPAAVGLAVAPVLVLALPAPPAAAHAGGLTPADVRGFVTAVSPPVAGLTVRAVENGARLRLDNGTGGPVVVDAGGGPETPRTVPPGGSALWRDGRAAAPGPGEWTVGLRVGTRPVVVAGRRVAEPPPPAAAWWAALLAAAVAVPVLTRGRTRALAVAGLVVAAASVGHVLGSTLVVASGPPVLVFLGAAGVGLLAWPLAAVGALGAFRGAATGTLAGCAAAALTAVLVLPDVTAFHHAVLPFAWPPDLERALVALALGGGLGVALTAGSALRRAADPVGARP